MSPPRAAAIAGMISPGPVKWAPLKYMIPLASTFSVTLRSSCVAPPESTPVPRTGCRRRSRATLANAPAGFGLAARQAGERPHTLAAIPVIASGA